MKALDVESSKIIDLEKFVPRDDLDPVYLDTPYYLYPDGSVEMVAIARAIIGRGSETAFRGGSMLGERLHFSI